MADCEQVELRCAVTYYLSMDANTALREELMLPDIVAGKEAINVEIEKLSGGFMNAILGGLIFWVAQTTFHHSGELAGINQKFDGISTQHENLQVRLDGIMSDLDDRTQARFTSQDGDKLYKKVEIASDFANNLERRFCDRLTSLQLKIIALETHGVDQMEIVRLRDDIDRLQATLYSTTHQYSKAPRDEPSARYSGQPSVARFREATPTLTR